MQDLFKKVAVMTDLHHGLKNNSSVHNTDLEEYVDWFIAESKQAGCDTAICMGDWSHHRNALNLLTLDISVRNLEKLGAAFNQFFWFPGNHDLFFKDKRDIHSSSFGKYIPGVTVLNGITELDGVTMVPWLVGDEWKSMKKVKSRYVFGHFELPLFYMNSKVQMPDHGELQAQHFANPEYVFSGHFHKRQAKDNIVYIGNAFPHNYADAGDDERGMMILEWGKKPEYRDWPNAPKYRTLALSELLDTKDEIMKSKMHLRVNLDIDISYEEANQIKETFTNEYDVREISFIQSTSTLDGVDDEANLNIQFHSVDQIVAEELQNIDSTKFNPAELLNIYHNL
jgi:DNA repair exonuclease SbcCD nuclease subunit